jgi:hypothetical protein
MVLSRARGSRSVSAGGADGVELIGLGSVAAGWAGGSVDLDDPFAVLEQESGQSGAEASGSFDRPDPTAGCVPGGEGLAAFVAHGVGGALQMVDDGAGGRLDDSGVLVSRWVSTPMT